MNNFSLYALTVLIWGTTWYAITFQLGSVHPILSVSYRFMVAAAALFIYVFVFRKKSLPRFSIKEHGMLAMLGVYLFGLNYVLF